MKIKIIAPGKTEKGFVADGVDLYLARLQNYCFTELDTFQLKGHSQDRNKLLTSERLHIEKRIPEQAIVVSLDERGKEYTSVKFADLLASFSMQSTKQVCFVIGGAYGIHNGLLKQSDHIISLSKFTFTHQMARLILLEQLYRGFSILANEKYHHT